MDSDEIGKLVDLAILSRQWLESCLVGKVFFIKVLDRETFGTIMPQILQAKKSIAIEMVGENLFSLSFNSIIDKKRVLLDGPCNYFKDLVIFAEPCGLQNPNDIYFSEVYATDYIEKSG